MSQSWDLELLASVTRTYTADGIVAEASAQSWDLELLDHNVVTRTYTADAVVASYDDYPVTGTARVTRTYTADGVVIAGTATTNTRTYTADARILATTTRTYTADARIATSSPGPSTPTIVLDTSIDLVEHDTTVSLSDDGTATVTISESSPVS
jgi:hypothetical protein